MSKASLHHPNPTTTSRTETVNFSSRISSLGRHLEKQCCLQFSQDTRSLPDFPPAFLSSLVGREWSSCYHHVQFPKHTGISAQLFSDLKLHFSSQERWGKEYFWALQILSGSQLPDTGSHSEVIILIWNRNVNKIKTWEITLSSLDAFLRGRLLKQMQLEHVKGFV